MKSGTLAAAARACGGGRVRGGACVRPQHAGGMRGVPMGAAGTRTAAMAGLARRCRAQQARRAAGRGSRAASGRGARAPLPGCGRLCDMLMDAKGACWAVFSTVLRFCTMLLPPPPLSLQARASCGVLRPMSNCTSRCSPPTWTTKALASSAVIAFCYCSRRRGGGEGAAQPGICDCGGGGQRGGEGREHEQEGIAGSRRRPLIAPPRTNLSAFEPTAQKIQNTASRLIACPHSPPPPPHPPRPSPPVPPSAGPPHLGAPPCAGSGPWMLR
jgi:hypothetical protein